MVMVLCSGAPLRKNGQGQPPPTPPRSGQPARRPPGTVTAVTLTRTRQARVVRGRGRGAELLGVVAVGEPPPPEVPRLPAGVSVALFPLPPSPQLEPARGNERVSHLSACRAQERRLTGTPNRHSGRPMASRGVGEAARPPRAQEGGRSLPRGSWSLPAALSDPPGQQRTPRSSSPGWCRGRCWSRGPTPSPPRRRCKSAR